MALGKYVASSMELIEKQLSDTLLGNLFSSSQLFLVHKFQETIIF